MKYELTQQQLQTLVNFLAKTPLTGAEVGLFNDLLNVFSKPIKEEITEIEKDDNKSFKS